MLNVNYGKNIKLMERCETMGKYGNNDFGKLIHNIRKTKKISAEVLANGLCSVRVLRDIEAGDKLPGYLLRNALIGRLGLAPEWFDNMLTPEEYEEWKIRVKIINAISDFRYSEADKLIEEYKVKYAAFKPQKLWTTDSDHENEFETDARLRMQFCLTMKGIRAGNDSTYYERAAALTSDVSKDNGIDADTLAKYKLSVNELNLYVQAAWLSGDKKETENSITTIIEYMNGNYYDNKARTKLFSKLTVYYCRLNINTSDADILSRMWKLCKTAVDMLRADKKSYYIIELFEIQMRLADRLCVNMKGDIQLECRKNMEIEKQRIKTWHDVMTDEYRRRGIPAMMVNDCYIYREGMAYCINDVIRARRSLFRISRKELSEGICAEKTIEKTEQHRSSLHYTNMKKIYEKLNLPCTYQHSSIIAGRFADLEKEEEMWNLIGGDETTEGLAILCELKENLPDYEYNRQILGWAETMIMKDFGKLTTQEALHNMINLVELTVPIEYIRNFSENKNRGLMKNERMNKRMYFTSAEIKCLLLISGYYGELEDYENALFFLSLLYEYFTDNDEKSVSSCAESVYRMLIITYSSMLGNQGEYKLSNELADTSAKLQLQLYRPQKIWWHKYNNLWNDNIKENDKEKYNTILMECATLCQIYDNESVADIFIRKILD